jgi:hypothetical protein
MNSGGNNSEAVLPFETFLDDLRRQGFHIGVEHHLRLRVLLNHVADDCDPAQLKTLLCPMFATNAEQQEFFYRTFDAYYPFLQVAGPIGYASDSLTVRSEVKPARRIIRRWPYLAAAVVAAALSVAFLTWKTRGLRQPTTHPDTPPAAGPQVPQRPADVPNTSQPSSRPEQSPRIISRVTRIPPSVSPKLAWYSDQRIALGWAAVMGPVLFWLFYEVYRYRRRRLLIRKAQGKVPPYSWPIRTDLAPEIYPPQDLAAVSRLLHRRYQGETERLDVAATVQASITALGFPTFRYRKDSRLPEYLFLIDRAGFRDHQARLHEHLAAMLNGQGLYVSVYFYEGDPRICWNSTGDESVSLDQLLRMFPGYRLLLFGDGDQLLDAVSGKLAHWHRLLIAWPDRALLTTEPPSQWGLRELTLATQFAIAPATLDGLASVAAYFELPSSVDLRGWQEPDRQPGSESASMMDALRRYLGAEAFQWLCACAIYPELQWDLTLRIGALPSLTPGLISEENLVRLLRLEWFRTGSMPDDLRRELLAQLDVEVQREVREAIISLLETNPPPSDTFAASAHQFQIAFQRHWAHPRDRQARRELKAALENVSPDELAQDYAYLDAAESVSQSPLQLLLPSRLRRLVFPAGASWLGTRSGARLIVLVLVIVGSLQVLRQFDKRSEIETARYSAELSKGVGLSVAEANGKVRVSWSTETPALRSARSGTLTITEGGKTLQFPLGREELNAGTAEYPPVSGNLSVQLAVTDDVKNMASEQIGYQLSKAPSSQEAQTAKAQTGSISIAGKTFRPPKTQITTAQSQIDAPPAIMSDANQAGNIVDRVLTSTGVLPPPVQLANTVSGGLGFGGETPVGLVLSAIGAKLLRADTATPLDARPGDLLFARDGLRTAGSTASFLFCPTKTIDTLSASGEVRFEPKQVKVNAGKISETLARACTLPPTIRTAAASPQHYGVTMSRGLAPDVHPTPRDKLPTDVAAELAPLDAALKADPNDKGALIAEASVFEEHKLIANALEMYANLLKQWPDAFWIKSKVFDLEQALAARNAPPPILGGKTYAVLIGISKYAKPELSLQFADADARSMAQFLESPRGGGVPSGQVLVLTNEQATTAAVRHAFQDVLKRRATKNDTVFILLSAQGTVESKNAYMLAYDSDPQDLKSTALPIVELEALFTEQLSKVGRVLLFVDVAKAGVIGTIKNTTVSANVQQLGDVEGDLLGLLASSPKEVTLEGPQFGGGHGVFSYYVMKGLEGAADANGDGVVEARELIEYVTNQVIAATGNKQHPREFGSYDPGMRLSDIKKPGPTH